MTQHDELGRGGEPRSRVAAVEGGFAQVNHGKAARLKRMKRVNHILYCSPREEMNKGDPVQAFTAIGRIEDDEPHQVRQSNGFEPFRREVHYFQAHDPPIKPMLGDLALTRDKQSWGMALRRGTFAIDDEDYHTIARSMGVPRRVQISLLATRHARDVRRHAG